MACTATATHQICQALVVALHLRNEASDGGLVVCGTVRTNIRLEILSKKSGDASADSVVQDVRASTKDGVAIVYVHTKRDAEHMARRLAYNKLRARAFHAGMNQHVRERISEEWQNGAHSARWA